MGEDTATDFIGWSSGAKAQWIKHTIDESFSQVHVLKLVDLDGDGKPELMAGKRYRGHNGNDPGSYDPLVIYYYRIDNANRQVLARYPCPLTAQQAPVRLSSSRTWTATVTSTLLLRVKAVFIFSRT